MFQENFDDDVNTSTLEAKHSIKRKPVGTAPLLPKLEFGNQSNDNLSTALHLNKDQASTSTGRQAPRGPRPEPPSPSLNEYTYQPQKLGQVPAEIDESASSGPPTGSPKVTSEHLQNLQPTESTESTKKRNSPPKLARKPVGSAPSVPSSNVAIEGTATAAATAAAKATLPTAVAEPEPVQEHNNKHKHKHKHEQNDDIEHEPEFEFEFERQEHEPEHGHGSKQGHDSKNDHDPTYEYDEKLPTAVAQSLAQLTMGSTGNRNSGSSDSEEQVPVPPPKDHRYSHKRGSTLATQEDTQRKSALGTLEDTQRKSALGPLEDSNRKLDDPNRKARMSLGIGRGLGMHRREISEVSTSGGDDSTEEYDEEHDDKYEKEIIASGSIRGNRHLQKQRISGGGSLDSESFGFEPSASKYWKYHVLKYSKDLYLTTNPDTKHLSRPVGPSYYVDIDVDDTNHDMFTLVFNDTHEKQPVMTVTRNPRNEHGLDSFSISVHSQQILKGTNLKSWVGQAVQVQTQVEMPNHRTVKCEQYSFQDVYGNEWVVGNRPEIEVQKQHDSTNNSAGSTKLTTKLKVSSRVYFFLRGSSGPESDIILAVYRRRHPKRKRIVKESLNKLSRDDDSNQVTQVDDDDANNEKTGWLYILDTIMDYSHHQPWMWPVVIGLVNAVAQNQRLDQHDKTLPKLFSNIKQRARDVRRSMYGGVST